MRTRLCVAPGLLILSLSAFATPVQVGDLEWSQPGDSVNLSYNQVAEVCGINTGACAGAVGEMDLTGWTWASAEDVGGLFSALTPHPGGIANYFENDSTWAADFLALFTPTWETIAIRQVMGLTRTPYPSDPQSSAIGAEIRDWHGDFNHHQDAAFTLSGYWQHTSYANVGHWFYRTQTVSEPATLALSCLALLGIATARRATS